jgi:hypothetical protein
MYKLSSIQLTGKVSVVRASMDSDWITPASVGSFAGATSITTVVSNGIQRAFNINPTWLGLIIAEALCIAIVFIIPASPDNTQPNLSLRLLLAIINGFFVFAASAGVTKMGDNVQGPAQALGGVGPPPRRFWSSWF